MNPKREPIPGLRQPTAREQAWIAEKWGPEARRAYQPKAGKFVRYLGIFLICAGAASLARGGEGVVSLVGLAVLGVICIAFSTVGRNSARTFGRRVEALQQGRYQVAPARSTKIFGGESGNNPSGMIHACLPDGEPLSGSFQIPWECANPLLRQKVQSMPVLLIRIEGDPEILAIPAP